MGGCVSKSEGEKGEKAKKQDFTDIGAVADQPAVEPSATVDSKKQSASFQGAVPLPPGRQKSVQPPGIGELSVLCICRV